MELNAEAFAPFFRYFNSLDPDEGNTGIKNADAWEYMKDRIPLFDCPDPDFMLTYYFRWWLFRKHIHETPEGHVITEFLPPVSWAGKYNTIVMAAGHHIHEARWLRNDPLWKEYLAFWYGGESKLHDYSHCLPAAAMDAAMVTGDKPFVLSFFDAMCAEHKKWEDGFEWDYGSWIPGRYEGKARVGIRENGLFTTIDDLEGSEFSAGWKGYRPLLNSCMAGSRRVLADMARELGKMDLADFYQKKADELCDKIRTMLWDEERDFFTVIKEDGTRNHARELYGYTPWLFDIPTHEQEVAWKALSDPDAFLAPAAMPFLEQCHPEFALNYTGHPCQWNGPSWPLATSFALEALIRVLNLPGEHPIGRKEFYFFLRQYVASHRRITENGTVIPCLEEDQNPYTGEWISRTMRLNRGEAVSTGRDYNHSSCNNMIITGLCGLRPSFDREVTVNPLLPDGVWKWFCLDGVPYHGHLLTIRYDEDGTHYGHGKGLTLLADGEKAAQSDTLAALKAVL